ncbi:MAG: helix-turn-helix domain-containing protein [Fimbriimonadaceae bacterium]|nr:helix-turn-helix domain-containing protein [Fimbriimonadaceae bacterium]
MDQLLGVADAARILGVVPATVRQMERDGRLKAQKTLGGVRVFQQAEVERVAQDRRGQVEQGGASTARHGNGEDSDD